MLKRPAGYSGFTIVETLIVLAIAGLFLMIVFEAIPALQRNSRNNMRRQDVSAILQAVSHYELDNSGGFPARCGDSGNPLCNSSSTEPLFYTKLAIYDAATANNVVISPQAASTNTLSGANNVNRVDVYNYYKCDPNNPGQAKATGAAYNDVVALFTIETGSGTSGQCLSL